MFRIDDPTAAAALPTPEAAGTEGYFTEGNPATSTPATNVRASFLNMLMEEVRNVVVAGALTPSKTTYNQLLNAIKAVAIAQFTQLFSASGWVKLPNGLILQWGSLTTSASGTVTQTFPLTFPSQCYSAACMCLTGGSGAFASTEGIGVSGIVVAGWTNNTTRVALTTYYIAIGK